MNTKLYLRTLLKLFWRDIVNNLDSKTIIKFQLRIQLKQKDESDKFINLVRSLSKVQIIMKGDYTEFFQILRSGLYLLSEEYEKFYVSSFVLFYSISLEISILPKSILVSN